MNKKLLEQVVEFSGKPALFAKGTGNIWTEPHLSDQMLSCHVDLTNDLASRREETIERTVSFLNKRLENESSILDLGCGPGLYAERLFKSGHKVTGVDFSENSIEYARDSAKSKGMEIDYVCSDFLKLEYKDCYDMAMQVYGELNTFSNEDRDKLLKIVKEALKPGGLFIFDVTTPGHKENGIKKDWQAGAEGFWRAENHIVLQDRFDYEDNIWAEQYIVIDEQDIKVYRNWFHDYTKESIVKVVKAAGFSEVQVLGGLYTEEEENEADWLTVIARA